MSQAALDHIFHEIYEFEEEAKKRREQLHEIKHKVSNKQTELNAILEENACLTGQLIVKSEKLTDSEAELQCLHIKENTLSEHVTRLKDANKHLKANIADLDDKRTRMNEDFCNIASEFTKTYGILSNSGASSHTEKCNRKKMQLNGEISQIKGDIAKVQLEIDRQNSLSLKVEDMRKMKADVNDHVTDLLEQKQQLNNRIGSLNADIATLEAAPQKSQDFKRLRFELSRLQSAEADAKGEQLRWAQHELERERQRQHNPWFAKHHANKNGKSQEDV